MIIYGIDLTTLPQAKRAAVHDEFEKWDIMRELIIDKSEVMVALVVFWDEPSPFPCGIPIPANCPVTVIPSDGISDYRKYILSQ